MHVFPQSLYNRLDVTQIQFLSRVKAGLNSEFSFFLTGYQTKAKEPSLSYHLPIAGERTDGFMPFSRVLVWSETQTALSRIQIWVADSISYDNNNYIKCNIYYRTQ